MISVQGEKWAKSHFVPLMMRKSNKLLSFKAKPSLTIGNSADAPLAECFISILSECKWNLWREKRGFKDFRKHRNESVTRMKKKRQIIELKDEAICRKTYERSVWAVRGWGLSVWCTELYVCLMKWKDEQNKILWRNVILWFCSHVATLFTHQWKVLF